MGGKGLLGACRLQRCKLQLPLQLSSSQGRKGRVQGAGGRGYSRYTRIGIYFAARLGQIKPHIFGNMGAVQGRTYILLVCTTTVGVCGTAAATKPCCSGMAPTRGRMSAGVAQCHKSAPKLALTLLLVAGLFARALSAHVTGNVLGYSGRGALRKERAWEQVSARHSYGPLRATT